MKIALCISGQMRTCKSTYSTIYTSIISKYNPDVFIHTWDLVGVSDKETSVDTPYYVSKELLQQYNPKKYIIEKFKVEYRDTLGEVDVPDILKKYEPINYKGNLPMYFKIKKCFELMEEYEDEVGFKYDIVIRLRPDLDIYGTLPNIESINRNTIYLSHMNITASDQFAMGYREPMLYYSSLWKYLNKYWIDPIRSGEYKDILVGERMMKYHLNRNESIQLKVIDADFIIRRFNDSRFKKIYQRVEFYAKRLFHRIR